jgi:cysteine synthase A
MITGVGTGGHITGVREGAEGALAEAAGVRGGADAEPGHQRRASPAPHPIQGIGAGFIPKPTCTRRCSTA